MLIQLLLVTATLAFPGETLHFAKPKRFEQKEGLPPKLFAVFDVDCGDELVDTFRIEETGPKGVSHIHVGGIVRDNPLRSCVGETREVSRQAGRTYSGRAFELHAVDTPAQPKVTGGSSKN